MLTIAGGVILGGIGLLIVFLFFAAWAENDFAGCGGCLATCGLAVLAFVGWLAYEWLRSDEALLGEILSMLPLALGCGAFWLALRWIDEFHEKRAANRLSDDDPPA